jgi:excisionase family DNA binding protein
MHLDAYVPIDALAAHLHVKVSTVRQWVKRGYIPRSSYIQVGKTYRFHLADVVQALRGADTGLVGVAQDGGDVVDSHPAPVQLEFDFGE